MNIRSFGVYKISKNEFGIRISVLPRVKSSRVPCLHDLYVRVVEMNVVSMATCIISKFEILYKDV